MPETLPTSPNFTHSRFYLSNRVQVFESALSGQMQTKILGGSYWKAEYTLPAMARADWQKWVAFFDSLNGMSGTFYALCPDCKTSLGISTGSTPLINGASQIGTSVVTDGWSNSTLVLKAGDFISFNGELKRVTEDLTSDGSGNGTINFVPKIRTSPSDNATITVSSCSVPMRLTVNNINFRTNPNGISEPLTFNAEEVVV